MLRTKSLISSLKEVPREWVFEFYLKLDEKLTGQDVNIRSPFSKDERPSLYIYYSTGYKRYLFKDFSTGKSGDGVTLVKEMFSLADKGEAAHKVMKDYDEFVSNEGDYKRSKIKVQSRYKLFSVVNRKWTKDDAKYWTKFHIGSSILNFYNVKPISNYVMVKEEEGKLKELNIKGHSIYGYYKKDGELYKIYQPFARDNKFIKVQDYVQGSEQLTMKVPYLVICSSLKDVMSFKTLRYNNVESIAPDSENCLMPPHMMSLFKTKYKKICVLFDNDQAGIASMKKYKEKFGTPEILLKMSKDLSDSVRDSGLNEVRRTLTPLIRNAVK